MPAAEWTVLLSEAQAAARNAYAPYSRFAVGAAVSDAGGALHGGCNVENASFGLTVCAERNAIAAAAAAGLQPGGLMRLVIYAEQAEPVTPCGACRQVLAEFAAPECRVRCYSAAGACREFTLDELLPERFVLRQPGI